MGDGPLLQANQAISVKQAAVNQSALKSLSAAALCDLACIRAEVGSPARLRQGAVALQRYEDWCRRALAENHLVSVAACLRREFGLDLNDLEAIGVPVDLLGRFPHWEQGSRHRFRPQRRG